MTQWTIGRVVENRQWGEKLHSLKVDAEISSFEAGQFARLALEIDGEIIARPYSLVNSPDEHPLEFYFSHVLGGKLSGRLACLLPGAEVLVAPSATGFLTMNEVPMGKHLFMLSTGTGVGPFISILKTNQPWQRFERIVLVHAVRWATELIYQDIVQCLADKHSQRFAYIPFVSREISSHALSGRIPEALADGRLECRAKIGIEPLTSQVMLCGNPGMVEETMKVLVSRGLKKHRRSDPGQINVENYW